MRTPRGRVATASAYEHYSNLDSLGRCGVAIASCGKEIILYCVTKGFDTIRIKAFLIIFFICM